MTAHKWNYNGDLNIHEGGYYWREDGSEDYVCAVRVTPCSDAGGPDNLFRVEAGTVYIGGSSERDVQRRASALACIGIDAPEEAQRRDIVEGLMAYGGMDDREETVVRIGKPQEQESGGWSPLPDVILRGNASLRRYIKREFL